MKRLIGCTVLVALLALIPLSTTAAQDSPRPYRLGFTPWPYAYSTDAVDYTYARISTDADLIAHHLDDGIPWAAALAREPYHPDLMRNWQNRRDRTPEGHAVYLAITPLNMLRDDMAGFRREDESLPLTAPWDSYGFDHPDVKTAYVNYLTDAIEFFDPDYLCFGIEVNLLIANNPGEWDAYMALQRYTYTELKIRYPDLPAFVSVTAPDLLAGWTDVDHAGQMQAIKDVIAYSDYYGLSLYPFMSAYMTTQIPATMYDDLLKLSDKPVVIAETGYPAQTFSIMDGALTFETDADKQLAFIEGLLEAADQHNFEFIVLFAVRDYDEMTEFIRSFAPEIGDLAAIWQDTGLYDEDGVPRPALTAWLAALARPYAAP